MQAVFFKERKMTAHHQYILIGKTPVAISDECICQWVLWYGHHHNSIRRETIPSRKPFNKGNAKMLRKINHYRQQEMTISTIFLGLNYAWGNAPFPILFETMIFGGMRDGLQVRYSTIDEAINSHNNIVKKIKSTLIG